MNDNAPGTVSVGCKLPNGIHLDLKSQTGELVRFTLNGSNASRIVGGYGITENVPEDFITSWIKKNSRHLALLKGLIFIHKDRSSTEAMAKERREAKTGFEPLDPVSNGMLRGEDEKNDPKAVKAYNTLRSQNPDRNRQIVE